MHRKVMPWLEKGMSVLIVDQRRFKVGFDFEICRLVKLTTGNGQDCRAASCPFVVTVGKTVSDHEELFPDLRQSSRASGRPMASTMKLNNNLL